MSTKRDNVKSRPTHISSEDTWAKTSHDARKIHVDYVINPKNTKLSSIWSQLSKE